MEPLLSRYIVCGCLCCVDSYHCVYNYTQANGGGLAHALFFIQDARQLSEEQMVQKLDQKMTEIMDGGVVVMLLFEVHDSGYFVEWISCTSTDTLVDFLL